MFAAKDFFNSIDPERTPRKVWVKSGALHFCETNSRGEVHLESADYEALVAALGFHCWRRVGSDCTGRAMCPRARRHGRNHPGPRPVLCRCFGTAGAVG